MKEFDKCIAACHKAIEVGQDHHADYKTIAKAYARIAKAFFVQKQWADAIHWYDKALTNDRNSDYIAMKKKAEKSKKEEDRLAYIDPAKAVEAKERGNELFKQGNYPSAIREYTEAIKRNPEDGKLFSNRAAAYTKLAEFNLALDDCAECIRLAPDFVKGYLRKANIHLALKQFSEARKAYEKVLEMEPNHSESLDGLRKIAVAQAGVGMTQQERAEQALKDPEIQQIMGDPVMQQILQQMAQDPKAVQEHLKDPVIGEKIQKLAQAGIIGFK
jgi:stress-induced-phosphoprotein 1